MVLLPGCQCCGGTCDLPGGPYPSSIEVDFDAMPAESLSASLSGDLFYGTGSSLNTTFSHTYSAPFPAVSSSYSLSQSVAGSNLYSYTSSDGLIYISFISDAGPTEIVRTLDFYRSALGVITRTEGSSSWSTSGRPKLENGIVLLCTVPGFQSSYIRIGGVVGLGFGGISDPARVEQVNVSNSASLASCALPLTLSVSARIVLTHNIYYGRNISVSHNFTSYDTVDVGANPFTAERQYRFLYSVTCVIRAVRLIYGSDSYPFFYAGQATC
jgi:hypothetical protein